MKKGNLIHDHSESVAIKGLERNRGWRYNYFGGHMLRAFLAMCTYGTLLTGNYLCHPFGVNNDYVVVAWAVGHFS